jgi:hypothetical protein
MCIEATEWTGDGAHTTKRIFRRAFERNFLCCFVILRESWGGWRGIEFEGQLRIRDLGAEQGLVL